jgi:hypothetical protein
MLKRRRIILAGLLVAVFGVIARLLIPSPEPAFRGKPLSAWLRGALENGVEGNQLAILQIGTNGIKDLLEMVRAKDLPLKRKIIALTRKQTLIRIKYQYI